MLLCLCPPLSSCTNTEPSLTPHNLTTALDTLPDDVWHDFGWKINVPRSKRDNIKSQYSSDGERKSALIHTYLTSHPAPSWQHITQALYRCDEGKHHAVLERVQRMFPTGDQFILYAISFRENNQYIMGIYRECTYRCISTCIILCVYIAVCYKAPKH